MKVLIVTILIIFKFTSYCQNIPKNIKIIAKYDILNISTPPYIFHHCTDDIKPFNETHEYHCTFSLSGKQITLRAKYVLNKEGKITEYWWYGTEGVLKSSIEEMKNDIILYPRFKKTRINIVKNNLVDTEKKVKIIEIFKKEKIILGSLNSKKVIYQYK